ncbi:hypothetical protein F5Y01DRAFT_263054 [Xylaria sp. FL0043]|nr:hypothetical protein F5Y01DRAFT_263054 [Xylaria sp. FL0043]
MAPKPPSKVQKSTKPSKQPRFSLQAVTKKEKSSPRPSTSTKIGEEPIYSPNIDTSELSDFTEEEQNPRPIRFARIDDAVDNHGGYRTGNPFALKATISDVGKTARQLRAEARSRKAASSESKTSPESETTALASQASPNAPAKGTGANGQVAPGAVSSEALEEETAQRRAAAAQENDRTDNESVVIVAEKLDSRPRKEVKDEIKDDPFLEDDIDDVTLPPCNPLYQRMPPPPPSIPQLPPSIPQPPRDSPTTDIFHQYFANSAAVPNPFERVPMRNPNPFAPIQPAQPAGTAETAGTAGPAVRAWDARQAAHDPAAVARYIELLVTRPGALPQQDNNSPLQSPSSPASSEGRIEAAGFDGFSLGDGPVFHDDCVDDDRFDFYDETETQGIPGDEQMDSGAATREYFEKVSSGEIFSGDNIIECLLGAPLRYIASTLNFMARAQASGIEIPDFADLDTLAAVSREQWEELADAPDDAGEIVAEELLNMSILDICLLSERAFVLRTDLFRLGVHID